MQSFAWARPHIFILPCLESNQTPLQKRFPSQERSLTTVLIFLDNKQLLILSQNPCIIYWSFSHSCSGAPAVPLSLFKSLLFLSPFIGIWNRPLFKEIGPRLKRKALKKEANKNSQHFVSHMRMDLENSEQSLGASLPLLIPYSTLLD